jgi:hypothetical protein
MVSRVQNVLFYSATLLVLLLPMSVYSQGDEDKFEITDCRGRSAGICLKGECTCDEWQIRLFKKDGKEWGVDYGQNTRVGATPVET